MKILLIGDRDMLSKRSKALLEGFLQAGWEVEFATLDSLTPAKEQTELAYIRFDEYSSLPGIRKAVQKGPRTRWGQVK